MHPYARWRTAEEALARIAVDDENAHGLMVKTVVGDARRNRLVKIACDAAADVARYAGEFGMTPVARARIAAGPHAQPIGGGSISGLLG